MSLGRTYSKNYWELTGQGDVFVKEESRLVSNEQHWKNCTQEEKGAHIFCKWEGK